MPIKTLVVDDTILYRKLASDVLKSFDEIDVVYTASNGELALKKMQLNPIDLVLCDVYMPQKNGVETLAEIKQKYPDTLVVMMSGISTRSANITIKALEMGAIDFIQKPDLSTVEENIIKLKNDIKSVLRLAKIKLATRGLTGKPARITPKPVITQKPKISTSRIPKTFGILTMGVSTGGPEALNHLLQALPSNFPVPIVMVQHMPPKFTQSLAESLNRKCSLQVIEASDGTLLESGYVYIAPGGYHMTLLEKNSSVVVKINDGPPENSCKPAVDVLFRSVANVFGDNDKGILAIVLTGMGNDGLNGVRTMKRKGCFCITQSESSCVVYGMPKAIDQAELSDLSIPLQQIAPEICRKFNV